MEAVYASFLGADELLYRINALDDIHHVIYGCPSYEKHNKSTKNGKLKTVQQLINAHVRHEFSVRRDWEDSPLVVDNLNLEADFRKQFDDKTVLIEFQCGNAARGGTDILKMLQADIHGTADVGIIVFPTREMAETIDSNVACYERFKSEFESLVSRFRIPILLVGFYRGTTTRIIDVSRSPLDFGKMNNCFRLVQGLLNNKSIDEITKASPYLLPKQQ